MATLTNAYATTAEMADELQVSTSELDNRFVTALNTASRQVDAHCNGRLRKFWQDATVVTRKFFADDPRELCVFDISTATGLVVKLDTNDDGAFATTLTVDTDFILLPVDAAERYPVEPFTHIRIVNPSYSFPLSGSGRPGVQVTAKFGWAAIPDGVNKACLMQAGQLYKAASAPFGGVQLGVEGSVIRLQGRMHPTAEGLLEDFVRRE